MIEAKGVGFQGRGRAAYGLLVLTLAFMVAMIDRVVLALLVDPIQADFGLSDTEMGLLSGLAFAAFYLVMSIPIGRLADRLSRRRILVAGIGLWSVMTALCGLAAAPWQLFAARMGVGVGESALSPAAYSMLADIFPRRQLGRAYSVFGGGALIGSGLAMMFGGAVIGLIGSRPTTLPLLGTLHGWQMVFLLASIPGFIVALLMTTVAEPLRRGGPLSSSANSSSQAFWSFIGAQRGLLAAFFLAFGCLGAALFGSLAWLPSFLARTYHVERATVGLALGAAIGIASPIGALTGGMLADRLRAAGQLAAPVIVGLAGAAGALLLFLPLAMAHSFASAVGIICALFFCLTLPTAAGPAGVQMITPPGIRAQVTALYVVTTGLAGMTIGSLTIGLLTDHVFHDKASVGWSIGLFGTGVALAMTILFAALRRPFAARCAAASAEDHAAQ